ncbi:NADH dehydrogenase subunit 2 (mitochondrion) [Carlito syrichta]|uniref:NADH-ubiquinone oxidoreductase chain 2 n=1 Tax=Carlito syrichta TaxID=1868482 RepID=C4T944_CARSF|nr:NADH dehydrogenase subunit 2 [Carlito syrichta]BAH69157.1 NADH dehydrogenase subunit 2 [Carlito syrichta]
MKPLTLSSIFLTLFSGTMITMFSSHWLLIWIGLEMSMLAITPILIEKANPRSTEAATKYFLIQATASMLLMMAVITDSSYSGQWTAMNKFNQASSMMILIALMMKLGLSPFHFWVPEVAQGVSLTSGMLLLTWQKLAPISILYQINMTLDLTLMTLIALTSIALGGWGGLNQTQLRKILAYSSIAHMGWMVAILKYNSAMMILNLLIYIILTITLFSMLILFSSTTILAMSNSWNKIPLASSMMPLILLSLGGLPPLTGFLPKWAIIQELMKNNNTLIPMLMAITALLNLFFYMRLTYSTTLTMFPVNNTTKMKWQFENTKLMFIVPTLTTLSTLLLPMSPMLLQLE